MIIDKRKIRPKKAHTLLKNPDSPYKQQSISLFTSLKADTNEKLSELDDTDYFKDEKKINRSLIDPEEVFTSLTSSETDDTNFSKIQPAYTFPQLNPFTAIPSGKKIVDGLPGPPQDLKAPIVKGRFVILSWKPPVENSEDIQSYSVYYRQENSDR